MKNILSSNNISIKQINTLEVLPLDTLAPTSSQTSPFQPIGVVSSM
jgi:hypothetical protein